MMDLEVELAIHHRDIEIERLRAALKDIAALDPMTADILTDDVGPLARAIAIQALK